jgi:DnaK suppressor protein
MTRRTEGVSIGRGLLAGDTRLAKSRRLWPGSPRPRTSCRRLGGSSPTPVRRCAFATGTGNVAPMDPDRARELLAAERDRVERALARLGHQDTAEPTDEDDPANLASDLYQDELDEGLADDLRGELAAVERAEARLAAGTYGLSIESGKPIPDERLEALPTAERTVEEEDG